MFLRRNMVPNIEFRNVTIYNQYGEEADYSTRQNIFEDESKKIIQQAKSQIQKTSEEEAPNYPALFRDLLFAFAKERQRIALEANSRNAHLFGKDRCEVDDGLFFSTPLVNVYAKANEIAIQQLATQMNSMKRTIRAFEAFVKKQEETVQGRKFSFQIEILKADEVQLYSQDIPFEELKKIKAEILAELPDATEFEIMKKFKEKWPNLYKQTKMHYHLTEALEIFPRPELDFVRKIVVSGNPGNLKSDWIVVTKRSEINGKMYAATQWLTWAYRNFQCDPVERMSDPDYRSSIMVIHQDVYLKDEALKECEQIFSKIMQWNSKTSTIAELKDQVALLRYIFAEAVPYYRGSAAIGEWLEGSIYSALGLRVSYSPSYQRESVDLLAISSLKYSDYLPKYHQFVHVN